MLRPSVPRRAVETGGRHYQVNPLDRDEFKSTICYGGTAPAHDNRGRRREAGRGVGGNRRPTSKAIALLPRRSGPGQNALRSVGGLSPEQMY
jgi:hypothetical protein